MNIETTHCDACDTPNIGCLVSRVAGETVLAICPFCVTDEELDSLMEARLCQLFAPWPLPVAGAPVFQKPAMASLFLGAWF
tara:strand:+ start:707 stop:949 length:243 start_codon:yes stop_codon:yes gene_type:complete